MERVERHLPRHDARLLARRGRARTRSPRASPARADLYEADGRDPFASINFITAHDGFTLRDLVSYNEKHNEANQEDNRDGTDDNRSWNCGAEGPTDDPEILALRARQIRNFLTTLVLSQRHADAARRRRARPHAGRQQQRLVPGLARSPGTTGTSGPSSSELLEFTRRLIELRQAHPVFHRSSFLAGEEVEGSGLPDAWWFRADGNKMTSARLALRATRSLGLFLNGDEIPYRSRRGRRITDDSFLLLVNAHHEDETFRLAGAALRRLLGGGRGHRRRRSRWATRFDAHTEVTMQSRSMLVMHARRRADG